MGKKTKAQREQENAIILESLGRILNQEESRSLSNSAFGTHALVMFAIDNKELFRQWVNEDAELNNQDMTDEDISVFLRTIHGIIHAAMVTSLLDLPDGAKVHLVQVPRHTRPL